MIRNTATADWVIHIAVLQATAGELWRARAVGLSAKERAEGEARITAAAKKAVTDAAAFLMQMKDPKAVAFGKDLLNLLDSAVTRDIAELVSAPSV